jgi:hypothetical protein
MSLSPSDLARLTEIQKRVRDQAFSVTERGWTAFGPVTFSVAELQALDTAIDEVLTSRRGRAEITPLGSQTLQDAE